jgi:hypothetical protein
MSKLTMSVRSVFCYEGIDYKSAEILQGEHARSRTVNASLTKF